MNTYRTPKIMKALTAATLLMAGTLLSHAQDIPAAINYQGKLTDNLGTTLTNGYYEIEFRIWDDPTSTSAGSFVWGRSFPLHVVQGGLFNILLSDDGGGITSPGTPQFNDLREAFGGEDRYLGLTIKVDPSGNVASPTEISPRQQLASAAYAIQAQTANNVRNLGVTSAALANGAVTIGKIASGAVETGNLAEGAVTTPKIAAGAVTSSKLNIDGDFHANDHTMFLRVANDPNHGLKYANAFGGKSMDGPALFGSQSGALGTTAGGNKAALFWDKNKGVSMEGTMSVAGDATMKGATTMEGAVTMDAAVTIASGPVSVFGSLEGRSMGARYTATTDGYIIYFGYRGSLTFNWWAVGNNGGPNFSEPAFFFISDADTLSLSWPVAKGEKWQLIQGTQDSGWYSHLHWRPLGK